MGEADPHPPADGGVWGDDGYSRGVCTEIRGCRRWTLIRQRQGKTSYGECQKREEWKEVILVQGKNMSKTCSPALTQALTEKTSLVLAVILNFPSTVP